MENIVASLITGLIGASAVELIRYFAGRRKNDADASQAIADAAATLIEPLQQRIESLEARLQAVEDENDDLRGCVEELTCQVVELGYTPCRKPRGPKLR